MNKPTKLTPPQGGSARPESDKPSLLERASESFSLDSFTPAAVPVMLDTSKTRKFSSPRPLSGNVEQTDAKSAPADPIVAETPSEPSRPTIVFRGEPQPVDRSLLRNSGLIDPDGGASQLLEEFRIIKRQVLATASQGGTPRGRRVLVCSPHPNEGKTFCAVNLALAIAGERDSEVLLIDADFAKPSVLARLGLEERDGLMDVLADRGRSIESILIGTDIPGLWLAPAGSRTGRDSEYLASDRMAEIVDRLTAGAPNRVLIFDSPPALAATPAAELAKHVGQVLVVARADMTGRAALEDALDLLAGCPDVKLLLNDATFSPSGRRFGSYYGYGE